MQTHMFCTYLPQSVKLRPETATEPPSAFSAGLLSKKYPSEQQVAENRLYKAEGTPPGDRPPTPPLIPNFTVKAQFFLQMHVQYEMIISQEKRNSTPAW